MPEREEQVSEVAKAGKAQMASIRDRFRDMGKRR
jgi:hypothetical protein